MSNVLRKPQKEQLSQNLNISTGQEAFEAAVVLELSESPLCLNETIAAKQFSFFGGNILVRLLAHLLKFPADGDLFSSVLIFTYRTERCGIRVIKLEESYTSKETFLDNDVVSTYQLSLFIFHVGEDLIQVDGMNFGHIKLHLQNVGVVFGIDGQYTVPLSRHDKSRKLILSSGSLQVVL